MTTPPGRSSRRKPRASSLEALEDRRLMAYGPPGPVFDVGATATDAFRSATDDVGRVTVAWGADDGSGVGVYARRLENGGHPLGDAFLVNAETEGDQLSPRVASSPGVTIVAWWSDSQVYYRRFDDRTGVVGDAGPLMATRGISPEFEIVDLDDEGFTIYSEGFQLRRYGLDGALQATRTLAPDREGWTTVESTSPTRASAGFSDNTVVTWSQYRARDEAGATVYDVQIMAAYLSAGFEKVRTFVLAEETGLTDLAEATGMSPGLPGPGPMIVAWLGRDASGPVFRARELIQGRYGAFEQLEPAGDVLQFDDPLGGIPTAISGYGRIEVHFVRPGLGGRSESYIRSWSTRPTSPSIPPVYPSIWEDGPTIQTPDAPLGSFQFLTLQPVAIEDFWLMRVDASGEILAQRFAPTESAANYTGLDVSEASGQVLVRITRRGDLSQPLTVAYATADPPQSSPRNPAAIPGVDYTPVSGEVTIEAGRSEAVVAVPILDDGLSNGTRTFWLRAAGASTRIDIHDDEDDLARDQSLFDYGPAGLWGVGDTGPWRKLVALDPAQMLALPGGVSLVDLGVEGLWSRDPVAGWRKINDVSPDAMIHGAGRAFLDYGPRGLWSWSRLDGWAKLNDVDPLAMTADDDSLFVDFVAGGLWTWTPAGGYAPISLENPHPEALASYGGVAYLDYGPSGLWSWDGGRGWNWINGADPETMAVGAIGLFVDYGVHGVWTWDDAGQPSRIMFADARSLSIADGALYAAYDVDGLRRWTPTEGWVLLNNQAPALVLTSPGAADAIFDYGPAGVWRWLPSDGPTSYGWRKINASAPQAIVRV